MDFKKAIAKVVVKNKKSEYKKRTAMVIGVYPDLQVKLRGGGIVDINPDSLVITISSEVLYSNPSNTHYANWTKKQFEGNERLVYDVIAKHWSLIKPNLKVDGNINDKGTFTISKIYNT